MKKRVLLGVTSGIAAYKSLELIAELKKEDIDVVVIMTEKATQMVSLHDFEKASGNKVYTQLFEKDFNYKDVLTTRKVDHVTLADSADVMVIAPATANTVAKLTYGLADDYITTTSLALTVPIIVCPSMNVHMWNNPATQENVKKLKSRGYQIIEPTAGMLACGYEGKGRLADIAAIKKEIMASLQRSSSLKGKKVIVTAGPTIERIDAIRHITNRSSGKMGIALAEQLFLHGAEVLLLRSKNSVAPRYLMQEKVFSTTEELQKLIEKYSKEYDIFFHTAAVSDFEIENSMNGKISSKEPINLHLKPRKKVVDMIKKLHPEMKVISFKAEYSDDEKNLIQIAKDKLQEGTSDAIIINDISKNDRGFEAEKNEVYIVLSNGEVQKISLASKSDIAKEIIHHLTPRLFL
jgi:phosphopantothenoylcysteine decarboxylase/phosphopantothenate--cysteine ligase